MGVAHLRVAACAAVLGAVLGTLSTPAAGQEVCDTCNLPWGSSCSMEPKQCVTHYQQLYAPYTDFGRFYVETDFMPLRRDGTGNVVFAMRRLDQDADPNEFSFVGDPGQVKLETDDLPDAWVSGLRIAAGIRLTDSLRIEGSYFGLHDWTGTADTQDLALNDDDGAVPFGTTTFGSLFSPFTNFGNPLDPNFEFDLNDYVSINFRSNLNSADVNAYYQIPTLLPRVKVTALGGVRYISVTEAFRYHARSNTPVGSNYQVFTDTDNDLIGPQFGALIQYQFADRGWIDFENKIGFFNNSNSQATSYLQNGVLTAINGDTDARVAFAGDLSLVMKIQPIDALMFDIGYHATFIDGLALAQDNAIATPQVLQNGIPATIQNGGDVIYHGPRIGARLTF